jgi:hypothetical protein
MHKIVSRALCGGAIVAIGLMTLSACSLPTDAPTSTSPSHTSSTATHVGTSVARPSQDAPRPSTTETVKPTAEAPVASDVSATIVIAGEDPDGAHVSASGYVDGVIENGGTCSFAFTGAGAPVVVESTGMADRSSTSCGLVQAPIDRFSQGSWNVVLSYSSSTSSATSAAQVMEIK